MGATSAIRYRLNNVGDILGTSNPITLSTGATTTATWTSTPPFPTIVSPNYAAVIVEPNTSNEEIIYITAYTAGQTSATVTRGQEGSSGVAHTSKPWVHGPTALDSGLSNFHGAAFTRSTNQTITTATGTKVSFDTNVWDTDVYWAAGNPTRFTIPSGLGGWYMIIGNVKWAASSGGTARVNEIVINGLTSGTRGSFIVPPAASADSQAGSAIAIVNLNVGDYFEMNVYQNSGGNLDIINDSSNQPRLTCHLLGI